MCGAVSRYKVSYQICIMKSKPIICISKCLLGECCRYNAEILPSPFSTQQFKQLSSMCQLLPFCPEVAAGMPTPRPPLHLVQDATLISICSENQDYTIELLQAAEGFLSMSGGLAGAILKEKSPSCGISGSKIYEKSYQGPQNKRGEGIFTTLLSQKYEGIPMISEKSWQDSLAVSDFLSNIGLSTL